MKPKLTKGKGNGQSTTGQIPPQAPESFDKWVDGQDIMQEFHPCPRTLYNWRKERLIPFTRIGNKIFYNRTLLEKMLQEGMLKLMKGTPVLIKMMKCLMMEE